MEELNKYYVDAVELEAEPTHHNVLRRYFVLAPTAKEAVEAFMDGRGVLENELDVGADAFIVDVMTHGGS